LRVPPKWLDNLLSHHDLPGIERGRQGKDRRISDTGLLAVEIVRLLNYELAVPMARATELAATALGTRDRERSTVTTPSGVAVVLPLADIERVLRVRIIDAVETVAEVRRGRPAKKR
jgi:hypothetical protein